MREGGKGGEREHSEENARWKEVGKSYGCIEEMADGVDVGKKGDTAKEGCGGMKGR